MATKTKTPTPAEAAAFIRVILDHHKPRIDTATGRGVRSWLLEAAASLDAVQDGRA
ncbi:hypothetical protein HDA30_001349 [Micrococcus cohnii]|uniref:Uncharacterized protein n=1 Tax=Micrococcus cohnii TaxID=993416 RepID=A0A7W7M3N4_9MICC|nr:hypothetical protein [Micrococcus cohnii]MBB4735841.1 hypothetical protein [Micrococcus cohnii]